MKNCVGTCLHLFSVCSPWQVWYFNPFWLQFYNKLQFTIFIMSRKAVAHISLSRIANHFHSHVKIHIGQHHVSVKYIHCIHFSTKSDSLPPSFEKPKDPFAIDLHFSRQAVSLTASLVAHWWTRIWSFTNLMTVTQGTTFGLCGGREDVPIRTC